MRDLNLIPKSYILEKKRRTRRFYHVLAIIGACILTAAAITVPLGLRLTLQWNMEKLEAVAMETSRYMEVENQFNYIKDLYKQREDEGNKLMALGVDIQKVLGEIEKASPEKLLVKDFTISGIQAGIANIKLNGVSASEDEVASFVLHLRENDYFDEVIIVSVKKLTGSNASTGTANMTGVAVTNSGYSFDISLSLNLGK